MPVACRYITAHMVSNSAGFPIKQHRGSVLKVTQCYFRSCNHRWYECETVVFLTNKTGRAQPVMCKTYRGIMFLREQQLKLKYRHLNLLRLHIVHNLGNIQVSYFSQLVFKCVKIRPSFCVPLWFWFHVLQLYYELIPLTAL